MFSVFPATPAATNTIILPQFVPLEQLHNIGHVKILEYANPFQLSPKIVLVIY